MEGMTSWVAKVPGRVSLACYPPKGYPHRRTAITQLSGLAGDHSL